MKKIVYIILALLLNSHITIGQTALMSDEDHRIMMNDYAVNLNTVLTAECPQGITIDQFKKKIVNGELILSSTAQTSILTYAEPLKTYGTQFAITKNLTATTDAEKIFLSSFAPSTTIDSEGNLVESTTVPGLTAIEMWSCALNSFNTGDCGMNGIISDKTDIKLLSKATTTILTQYAGNTGFLVMLNEFGECIYKSDLVIKVAYDSFTLNNFMNKNIDLINQNKTLIEETSDTQLISLFIAKEFQEISLFQTIETNYKSHREKLNQLLVNEMNENNITNVENTNIFKELSTQLFSLTSTYSPSNNSSTNRKTGCAQQLYRCRRNYAVTTAVACIAAVETLGLSLSGIIGANVVLHFCYEDAVYDYRDCKF